MKIYTSPIIGRLVSHHISWIYITYPEGTQVHIGWIDFNQTFAHKILLYNIKPKNISTQILEYDVTYA